MVANEARGGSRAISREKGSAKWGRGKSWSMDRAIREGGSPGQPNLTIFIL